jgi:hypothetical protein
MARRHLIMAVVALVLLVACGMWYQAAEPFSAEEHWLVGTWQAPFSSLQTQDIITIKFAADRRYSLTMPRGGISNGVWSLRNGNAVNDQEPNRLQRLLRPIAGFLGLAVGPVARFQITIISEDQFKVIGGDATRRVWTRVPAD